MKEQITTIWKFQITAHNAGPVNTIKVPSNSKILHVDEQNNKICIWFQLNPSDEFEKRTILIVATGRNFDSTNTKYIGTVKVDDKTTVLHVYEKID